jgi:hypothetical protein
VGRFLRTSLWSRLVSACALRTQKPWINTAAFIPTRGCVHLWQTVHSGLEDNIQPPERTLPALQLRSQNRSKDLPNTVSAPPTGLEPERNWPSLASTARGKQHPTPEPGGPCETPGVPKAGAVAAHVDASRRRPRSTRPVAVAAAAEYTSRPVASPFKYSFA